MRTIAALGLCTLLSLTRAEAQESPDALKQELASAGKVGAQLDALFPLAGLDATERLLELLQEKSERSQAGLSQVAIRSPKSHPRGLASTTVALVLEPVRWRALLRFLNACERAPRYLRVDDLELKPVGTPQRPRALRCQLVLAAYTRLPGKLPRASLGAQVAAWRTRRTAIGRLFAQKLMWSQKLRELAQVLGEFPEVWIRRLRISDTKGLELELSSSGASLRPLSRLRDALRAEPVLLAGLGRFGDLHAQVVRAPNGGPARLDSGFQIKRATPRARPPLRLKSTPGVAAVVAACLRRDHAGAVQAWNALRNREPKTLNNAELTLAAVRALIALRKEREAEEHLLRVLEQHEDHPEALLLLARLRAGSKEPAHREQAKDLLLAAARAGDPRVFRVLERVRDLGRDAQLLLRLGDAANEYSLSVGRGRDPFARPMRKLAPPRLVDTKRLQQLERRIGATFKEIAILAEHKQSDELVSRFEVLRRQLHAYRKLTAGFPPGKKRLERWRRRGLLFGGVRTQAMRRVYAREAKRLERQLADPAKAAKAKQALRALAKEMLADEEAFEPAAKKLLERLR